MAASVKTRRSPGVCVTLRAAEQSHALDLEAWRVIGALGKNTTSGSLNEYIQCIKHRKVKYT